MPEKNGSSSFIFKLVIVLAVVVAGGWLALNSIRPTAIVGTVKRDEAVDIVTGSIFVRARGNLEELKSDNVVPSRVISCDLLVRGTKFKKGDELVRLDSEDLKRKKQQAEDDFKAINDRREIQLKDDPRLKLAERNFDNAKRIHDQRALSDADFEAAQRTLDKLKTDLSLESFDLGQAKTKFDNDQAELKRQLEKMTIRAPSDGIVQDANVYVGALISQGTTVGTYYSLDRDVEAKISEESASKLQPGQHAKVRLLIYGRNEYEATVERILPFADPDTQRYTALLKVELEPEKLVPNSTGEVTITVAQHPNAVLAPRRALFSGRDGFYVFAVKNGRVEKRQLDVGFVDLNLVEVKHGLEPGEQVITDNLEDFHDGQRVRVTTAAQ